ncbi:MAG: hypothetical protein HYW07_22405 [Candidatus Latescibacteria bacterium]|nr:hypothetical protein [Candidatus Latescibacterota bacterium]
MDLPIPNPDPIPVPGEIGLILFLLYLTFSIHVVLMNILLGGLVLTFVSELVSRHSGSPECRHRHEHLAERLSHILPFAVSLTITFGIAPLLFVQGIYGQFFYTSSVLMAWVWLGVLLLILIGYYSLYLYTRGFARFARRRYWFIGISLAMFLMVAFIYVNNLTLMQTPQKWLGIYTGTQGSGWHWNLDEATLWPRYLHFALSAVAVAGMMVLGLGLRERDEARAAFMCRWGGSWFLGATALQIGVGLWFYYAIPGHLRAIFLDQEGAARILFVSAHVFFTVGALCIGLASFGRAGARTGWTGIGLILAGIAEKVINRDQLRQAYLGQVGWNFTTLQTAPQHDVIALFFVFLVAGLGLLAWVIARYRRETAQAR